MADTSPDAYARVDAPRGDPSREWEVFVREETTDPLRHAGSVSAPSVAIAREQATTLFGWTADALWLCPAEETVRLVDRETALSARAAGATEESAGESPGATDPAGESEP